MNNPTSPHKDFTIIVNAEKKVVPQNVLTFNEVVYLAFPAPPTGTDPAFSVTYKHAASKPHHGTLAEGGTVEVKDDTIFDVTATNRS